MAKARNESERTENNGDNSMQTPFLSNSKQAENSCTEQSRASCPGCQEHAVPLAVLHRELSVHMLSLDGSLFSPTEQNTSSV